MKRLRRWLFNGLAAASLATFIAVIALWYRSSVFGWDDVIYHSSRNLVLIIASSRGELSLQAVDVSKFAPSENLPAGFRYTAVIATNFYLYRPPHQKGEARNGSFYFGRFSDTLQFADGHKTPRSEWYLGLPYWFVALCAAILPGLWYVLFRHRRRPRASGQCPVCGYDLRATPDRCPECGNVSPMREKMQ